MSIPHFTPRGADSPDSHPTILIGATHPIARCCAAGEDSFHANRPVDRSLEGVRSSFGRSVGVVNR